MIAFHIIQPEFVHLLPIEAIEILDKATKKTPSPMLSVPDILLMVKHRQGSLVLGIEDEKVILVVFMDVVYGQYGRTLNLIEAGGHGLAKYRDEFVEYVKGIMRQENCQNMLCASRKGIGKLFPELKHIANVFELRITH